MSVFSKILILGLSIITLLATQYNTTYAAVKLNESLQPNPKAIFSAHGSSLALPTLITPTTATSSIAESASSYDVCSTPQADEAEPDFVATSLSMPSVSDLGDTMGSWLGSGLSYALSAETQLTERINILLLGSDSRPGQKYGHTDTMIVLTLDPSTKQVGLLSIPRDLWVVIPGQGENRINNAYRLGQIKEHPGGGPALVAETISTNLGIPVHHYLLVNFETFAQFIDTLGGLDICAPESIDSATYYGYQASEINRVEYYSFVPLNSIDPPTTTTSVDPTSEQLEQPQQAERGYQFLYIEAGQHVLDGHTALRYARSRASVTADFARVKRQQAVLMALRQKTLNLGLITKIPDLWTTMSSVIETDLQLTDILQLAYIVADIPRENIQLSAISHEQTMGHTTTSGASVLLPQRAKIKTLVESMFGEATPTAPLTQAEIELNLAASVAPQALSEVSTVNSSEPLATLLQDN